jgi:hypothetical protein
MRLLDRAPVCMGGEGVYIYFSIAPAYVTFRPYSWVRLFFLDSMAVYVFVVCMYVSVWCGGAPLSFSLDCRGDGGSGDGQQSRW